jgi:hypothetical protein
VLTLHNASSGRSSSLPPTYPILSPSPIAQFWNPKRVAGGDLSRDLYIRFGWPTIFYSFLSNMVHQGLQEVVVPLPLPSQQAATLLRTKRMAADLIHIDAAHEYGPVADDIHTWWPFVRGGGVLMGDDYSKFWPGVVKAVDEFAAACKLSLEVVHHVKWVLRKPQKVSSGLSAFCYDAGANYDFGVRG